jgi:hypothetical protein
MTDEQQPDIEQRVRQPHPDAEYRSLTTDIALFVVPPLTAATGAATVWALNEYGPNSDSKQSQQDEPKQVILPPGVDPE